MSLRLREEVQTLPRGALSGFWQAWLISAFWNSLENQRSLQYMKIMIKFTLKCKNDHEFEAWFGSSAEYERQHEAGWVTCAVCDDDNISKALMTPNLGAKGNSMPQLPPPNLPTPNLPAPDLPAPNQPPLNQPEFDAAQMDPGQLAKQATALITQMRAMRKQVEDNFDNVGDDFANTARRIHYGDEKERGIYGNASNDDVEELIDEGIEIFPMPDLPKDN